MFDKLKQAYDLKRKADAMKKELEAEIIDVEVGSVKVRVNGSQKILKLEYEDEVDPNKMKDAINKALDESQKVAAKKMQGMMGGMDGLKDLMQG